MNLREETYQLWEKAGLSGWALAQKNIEVPIDGDTLKQAWLYNFAQGCAHQSIDKIQALHDWLEKYCQTSS